MSTPDLRKLEEVVAAHPDVLEVAAVALDDGPGGPGVTAAVVPVDFASGPEIRDAAWQQLGEAGPRTVVLLAALPRTAAGEVDHEELARVVNEDDPPRSTYVPPSMPLETEVADVLSAVLDVPRVGLDDDFLELGGDSLRAIEVVNLLEQRTGLVVGLEELFDAATVRNLVRGAG